MLRWEPWRLGGFPTFTPHYPTHYPTPYPTLPHTFPTPASWRERSVAAPTGAASPSHPWAAHIRRNTRVGAVYDRSDDLRAEQWGRRAHKAGWRAAAQYIMWLAPSRSASCRTSPSTSSTAQRSCSTSLMTSATELAALRTTSNVQLELRGAHLRSSHAMWGWVGRAGQGWSAA